MTSDQFGCEFDEWAAKVRREAIALHANGVPESDAIGLAIQVTAAKQRQLDRQRAILNPIPAPLRRQ